jgi:hypothetical protein
MDEDIKFILNQLLEQMKDQRTDIRGLFDEISSINGNHVEKAACEDFRKDIYEKIDKLSSICTSYEASKSHFVDKFAVTEIVNSSNKEILDCLAELRQGQINMSNDYNAAKTTWNVVKSNKSLIAILILVGSGRIFDLTSLVDKYGAHIVLLWSMLIMFGLVLIWVIYLNRKKLVSLWPFFM